MNTLIRRIFTLFLAAVWASLSATWSAHAQDSPFGVNDAHSASGEKTSDYLTDLGVRWVCDHLPRRKIEKHEKTGKYDFSEIEEKVREYLVETDCKIWFVVNTESKFRFGDGAMVRWGKSEGKFVPNGPQSYRAFEEFLKVLVTHVNGRAAKKKALYWSIDNEHAGLFVPAFCDSEEKFDAASGRRAAQAYADLLELSRRVILGIDPEAKIVFGGPGGGTSDREYDLYYRPALEALKRKGASGEFDFFDYHNFNVFDRYSENGRGKGIGFFRTLLREAGFPDASILIKAGGTHTGMDLDAKNERLHHDQTERQQAEHLIKRFVVHAANGVQLILWGTVREDEDEHGTYSQNGLIHNGVPAKGDPSRVRPCPDPGDGIKKLSYHTFKFLNQKLEGSDFRSVETCRTGVPNVFLFKFVKKGKPVFVAWWDYFKESEGKKQITLDVSDVLPGDQATVTEAIPTGEAGSDLREKEFPAFFKSSVVPRRQGKLIVTIGSSPLFLE